jgi:hypothetical protein
MLASDRRLQIILLALSHGVTTLWTQGASKVEVKAVGRFLLDATLSALVLTKRP